MKVGVILAAGEGTRLKSSVPKYLQELAGWPLIRHSIHIMKEAAIDKIIIVLGHKLEEGKRILEKFDDLRIVEQKRRLGTAHALEQVLPWIPVSCKEFLLCYVDTPLLRPKSLRAILNLHKKKEAFLTVAYTVFDDPSGYGRLIRDQNHNVKAVVEEDTLGKEKQKLCEVNVGLYVFSNNSRLRKYLSQIKPAGNKRERWLTTLVEIAYNKGEKILDYYIKDAQEAFGVNKREDLVTATRLLYLRNAYYHLRRNVTIIDPEHTYIANDVSIGKDTIIYPFSWIEAGVKIGKNCSIGPWARIRSGCHIADYVSIGNFAELVRTKIGYGSKVRHFSYLGDTVVGRNVNIGAGTITANYDGRKKNKTKIADHAFIGSGTILVAPVKIGKGAITGAGSVVPKNRDVRPHTIVVGVPARFLKNKIREEH